MQRTSDESAAKVCASGMWRQSTPSAAAAHAQLVRAVAANGALLLASCSHTRHSFSGISRAQRAVHSAVLFVDKRQQI